MHKIADFMRIQGDYVKRLLICLHHNHIQSLKGNIFIRINYNLSVEFGVWSVELWSSG